MVLAVDFFEFVELSNCAKNEKVLFESLERYLKQFGLDRVIFSLITDHPSIDKKSGHGIMLNYPEDWMQYYLEKNYQHIDPVIHYLPFNKAGIFKWSELGNIYLLTAKQQKVLNEGCEAKLLDGIAVSFNHPGYELSGLGLASSGGKTEIDDNQLSMIYAAANQFNLVYRHLNSTDTSNNIIIPCLTPREKEVITWVSKGKNNWEISAILNISEHGVDFHMRNIFKKMDVQSRISAVVKCLRYKLINP